MNSPAEPKARGGLIAGCKLVLVEAGCVLIGGAILALAANAISPRGLKLGRDYFPTLSAVPTVSAPATNAPAQPVAAPAPTNAVTARLQARCLRLIEHADAVALFRDPRTAQEQILFVDARNDQLYQAGHIPGAVQLDYYRMEPYLPAVLAASQIAEKIVVYCTGGECEDSELAAALLGKVMPRDKIFVYVGGFNEWSASGQPLELGTRKSGVLKESKP